MAKFGIVVPFVEEHNDLVFSAMRSIYYAIEQSNEDVEVIMVKDKDKVGVPRMLNNVLENFRHKYCVYPIHDPHRYGVPSVLNYALKSFKEDYFGYFGADDIMLKYALHHLRNFNGDWCYGDCLQDRKPYYAEPFSYQRLKEENFIPAGSVFVRTEIIEETGWNERLTFAEDWEMWLQIGKKYKPTYINQPQYDYSMGTSVFNKSLFRRWNNKRKFR